MNNDIIINIQNQYSTIRKPPLIKRNINSRIMLKYFHFKSSLLILSLFKIFINYSICKFCCNYSFLFIFYLFIFLYNIKLIK